MHSFPTEAAVGAALAREAMPPIFRELPGQTPVAIFPKSEKLLSLEGTLPRPVRKRAAVTLHDHDSFIDYVKRHQEPGTALFGELDDEGASFHAVLDYHLPNGDPTAADFQPGPAAWCSHNCHLMMEHSPEWTAWNEKDGVLMTQTDFALFLEDNRLDIQDPDAATIIEIAKSLEATSGHTFKGQTRLDNGDRKFTYNVETTARAGGDQSLTIPEKIKLQMPVFINGPAFPQEAFFRYKLTATGVLLFYTLIRPRKTIEAAIHTAREAIESETGIQVAHGSVLIPAPTMP